MKKRIICFLIECLFASVFALKIFQITFRWSSEQNVIFLDTLMLSCASCILGMVYSFFFNLSDKVYDYIRNILKKNL